MKTTLIKTSGSKGGGGEREKDQDRRSLVEKVSIVVKMIKIQYMYLPNSQE